MVTANRQQAIDRLSSIIEAGRGRTTTALQEIQREWEERRDLIVPSTRVDFQVDGKGVRPVIARPNLEGVDHYSLTTHAYGQVLERSRIPKPFAERLIEAGEYGLLRENLNRLIRRFSPEGNLVRHVGGTIKGFLSTAYKRMDAGPVFEGLASEALRLGFMPYRGFNTDTRMGISLLWPNVYEPTPGEFVVYGISQTTGDYGGVANVIELMGLRIFCDNLMVGFNVYRRIHIGKRIGAGEDVFEFSKETHELDVRTVVSATKDAVKAALGYFEPLNKAITAAASRKPDVTAVLKDLGKKGVKKATLEQIEQTYAMPMPVEALPQEEGAWRLSNVLSLIAQGHTGDERLDLEHAAYEVLGIPEDAIAA